RCASRCLRPSHALPSHESSRPSSLPIIPRALPPQPVWQDQVPGVSCHSAMDALWQDIRFGWRNLIRTRRFALVALAMLAIGIGANTAMFSVVNAVLLRPLPFRDPDRLVGISGYNAQRGAGGGLSYQSFLNMRADARSIETISAFVFDRFTLTGGDEAE